jgi:hypothetical protein
MGVTAALVALYAAGLPPQEVYLAGAGLAGGVALAEIASAFRERDLHIQAVDLNLQLQILKDSVAPVLEFPEPSLSDTAYHVGELAKSLPLLYEEQPYPRVAVHLAFIRGFCDTLGLRFANDELRVVWQAGSDDFDPVEATRIIRSRAQSLRPPLLPFFQLGDTSVWLRSQLDQLQETRTILERLEELRANLFMALDPRFSQVVDALIEACRPYRQGISGNDRDSFRASIAHALAGTPSLATNWMWAQEDGDGVPMRMVGPYVIAGRRNGAEYEVTRSGGSSLKANASFHRLFRRRASRRAREARPSPAENAIITYVEDGWRCSVHPQARQTAPCWEMCLVLDAIVPLTEAETEDAKSGEGGPLSDPAGQ